MTIQQHPGTWPRMPVLFLGHGSPMNLLGRNTWNQGFSELAQELPRPHAILAISAHWYTQGSYLTANRNPPTLHDFGGFPDALYRIEYPAPGAPELAAKARDLLADWPVQLSEDWGLDHGSWSVLHWLYPQADIPVIQLSIDAGLAPQQHYAMGRALASLRDEGILILGSGNIVHNLFDAMQQSRLHSAITPDWARRFDEAVKQALLKHDVEALLALYPDSSDARQAHPAPDHWWPLLYTLGAADADDAVSFPSEGFDLGSISMRNVLFQARER